MKTENICGILFSMWIISGPSFAWNVSKKSLDISPLIEKENNVKASINENDDPVANGQNMIFDKSTSVLSIEEQAFNDYSQALEMINQGNEEAAIQLLSRGLKIAPQEVALRTELVRLFLKNHREIEAQVSLEDGLRIQQDQPELLKLLAMCLERQGDFIAAIEQLNKIPNEQKCDKDTLALLGHLYQQTRHYALARQQYDRLQQYEPENPRWTLGLALALDSEGNGKAALEGYEKLQTLSGVDFGLMKYAQERIKALKTNKKSR